MKLVNLTPHEVNIYNDQGVLIKSYPSEGTARIEQASTPIGELDGVPTCKVTYGDAQGLPAPQPGMAYIVSYITIAMIKEQGNRTVDDLYYPTEMVRDSANRILGSRYLAWGGEAV